jgi:hypothetical protein
MFIENAGQFDPRARFQARGGSGTLWLAEDALWLTLLEPSQEDERADPRGLEDFGGLPTDDQPRQGVNIKLSFVGANPHPRLEPFNRLDTHVSYFLGNDPARWHTDVPVWGGVRYVDLYPGIDLELSGEGWQWQPRLIVQPDADLSVVHLRVDGAEALSVESDAIRMTTAIGTVIVPLLQLDTPQRAPLSTGLRPSVSGLEVTTPFARDGPAFPSASNHPSDLVYSTFLGGNSDDGEEFGESIAVDASGSTYITGSTQALDFPTTPGAFQTNSGGGLCGDPENPFPCPDVFITKLNPTGSQLVYSTYLGGNHFDTGSEIVVDVSGAAYVTGSTSSANFPTTPSAFDPTYNGGFYGDAFVTKLDPTGGALIYSTFLGGNGDDGGSAIALGDSGATYVTGVTQSLDFPVTPGAFQATCTADCSNGEAFIAELNAAGDHLLYSTYLGGSGSDSGRSIAVDANNRTYIAGSTTSADFPVTPGAFQTTHQGGLSDAFVAKLNDAGTALLYSTFLGGTDNESNYGVALDGSGAAYVTGSTRSSNYPTTPGAFQTTFGGYNDAYVTKLTADGSALEYSTFLGGGGGDGAYDIAVDISGLGYIIGSTYSADFPITPGAFQTTCNNCENALEVFATKLNGAGSALMYSTFLGGNDDDGGGGIAVNVSGVTYLTGYTFSLDFPVTAGAFQTTHGGGICGIPPWITWTCSDIFVTQLDMVLNPLTPTPTTTGTPTVMPSPTSTPTPTMMFSQLYLPVILNQNH